MRKPYITTVTQPHFSGPPGLIATVLFYKTFIPFKGATRRLFQQVVKRCETRTGVLQPSPLPHHPVRMAWNIISAGVSKGISKETVTILDHENGDGLRGIHALLCRPVWEQDGESGGSHPGACADSLAFLA